MMKKVAIVIASLLFLVSAIMPEAFSKQAGMVRLRSNRPTSRSAAHRPLKKTRTVVAAQSVRKKMGARKATVARAKRKTGSRSKAVVARSTRITSSKTAATRTRRVIAKHAGYVSSKTGIWTRKAAVASKPKPRPVYVASPYSYTAPWSAVTNMTRKEASTIRHNFASGDAGKYSAQQLEKAGVFTKKSLWGGIFTRAESIKYIVMHSTETERPASGPQIIQSWNNRGLRHPGTPFMVDRDGKIYITVDPQYGTVHVEPTRAKWGVNNSNSIGIEMVRSGKQKYTKKQMQSTARLVAYLQDRYSIGNEKILSHGYVQPSDRTDPVGFNWTDFNNQKDSLSRQMVAVDSADGQNVSQQINKKVNPVAAAAAAQKKKGVQQLGWLKAEAFVPHPPTRTPLFLPVLKANAFIPQIKAPPEPAPSRTPWKSTGLASALTAPAAAYKEAMYTVTGDQIPVAPAIQIR